MARLVVCVVPWPAQSADNWAEGLKRFVDTHVRALRRIDLDVNSIPWCIRNQLAIPGPPMKVDIAACEGEFHNFLNASSRLAQSEFNSLTPCCSRSGKLKSYVYH